MPDPCMGVVRMGESYPCDPDLDPNKCENSLTIFSGENGASSMPANFYADGIFMIILGILGIIGTAYLHLVYAKSLRERAKVIKGESTSDSEDSEGDESEEESEDGALEHQKTWLLKTVKKMKLTKIRMMTRMMWKKTKTKKRKNQTMMT